MVEGSKPFEFRWLKNDHSLSDNDYKINIINYEDESQLIIDKLDRNDPGNYSCIVRNSFGTDIQSTILSVKGDLTSEIYFS